MPTILKSRSFSNLREEKLMASLSPSLNVMIMAVRKAGRRIIRDFGEIESLQVSQKSTADFMATTEAKAEKALLEYLQEVRPRYSFAVTDKKEIEGEDFSNRFLITPLDGVINFVHGIPVFSLIVTLYRDNDIFAGVIYNPAMDELFYAEKGTGAFLMTAQGDKRLRVSGRKNISEALIGVDFSPSEDLDATSDYMLPLLRKTLGGRRQGCVSLNMSYVAAGRFDGGIYRGAKPWQTAAGFLLVKEAGGHVRGSNGTEKSAEVLASEDIIATNDNMDTEITRALVK